MYHKLKTHILLSFILLFLHSPSYAQDNYSVHVQQFGLEEGLSHRSVSDIFKDKQGFLWIANGVNIQRYDGYEFKTFPLSEQKGTYNELLNIGETSDGWLYVLLSKAIDQKRTVVFLNPLTGEFLTAAEKLGAEFSKQLEELLDPEKYHTAGYFGNDTNQICLASIDGIIIFNFEKGLRKLNFPNNSSALPSKKIKNRIELSLIDSNGNYWLTTNQPYQILKFNPKENNLEVIKKSTIPTVGYRVREWKGEIYLADFKGRGTPSDYRTHLFKYDALGKEEKLFEIPKGLTAHEFINGMLWCIGESGWKVFDTSGHLLFELRKEDNDIELFGNMDYKRIISDEFGKFYLNSQFGFNIIEVKKSPFTQYFSETESHPLPIRNAARGISVHNDSILVSFEHTGLVLLDKKHPEEYKIISKSSSLGNASVGYGAFTILRDEKGYYWANHIAIHLQSKWSPDLKEETKINDDIVPQDQYNISWAIWKDENNCIWSAYNRELKRVCDGDSKQERFSFKDIGFGFEAFYIYHFLDAGKKQVWLSSEKGLYLFDTKKKKIVGHYHSQGEGAYYLPSSDIFHMHIDEDGNRWLGTRSGLVFWDTTSNEKRLFNRNDGLSNEVIYAVYEDEHNRLWLSSDYGIMSFDKETFDVQTYLPKDGIAQEEFNRISHFKATDGTIYFGGLNGVTSFHPDDFLKKEYKHPQVLLSGCIIFDGTEGGEVDAMETTTKTQTLTFDPNDRYFKLKFTLPTFEDRHKTLYAWKIGGVYDDWSYQKENTLQFGALPYGNHTLYIKGQNASGGWSPHELQLQIRVLKPFYLQSWFILFSIASIIGGTFLFFRSRTRRLRKAKEKLEVEISKATAQIQKDKQLIEEQAEGLKQLDKVKSRFFANVSHELRTPLTLILGPIGSAMKSGDLNDRNLHLMKKASRSGRELLKLVGSILDLSKMDSGKIEVYEQPEFLYPLLDRIINSFESHAQSNGITFNFHYQARKDLQVELDRNKIEVVINNLLSNAVKFTPDGGSITSIVTDTGDTISIRVKDTGRGIHPKDQPHVFDRFYQSQLADAPTEGGTGIGLALSNEFIKMMGGKISLESEFGSGTTFKVEIPKKETNVLVLSDEQKDYFFVKTPDIPFIAKNKIADAPATENKNLPTILVTEDNYSLRDYIVTILSPYYNVLTAKNGLKALDILQGNKSIQLIISDIMMPEMDGFQLLENLKSEDSYRHIPVVMLTARAEIKDKLKALRIGVDDYLLKPFEEEELLVRIENLLHNYQERVNFQADEKTDEKQSSTPSISDEDMEWLKRLEEHLFQHISNSSYSITQLSFDMAISERQLRRRLKQLTGLTPVQYFMEIRLGKAREFLEQNKYKTIAQTAFAVGFQAPRAFSRSFSKKYSKTPSSYITR